MSKADEMHHDVDCTYEDIVSYAKELEAKLEACELDAKRLDWLIANAENGEIGEESQDFEDIMLIIPRYYVKEKAWLDGTCGYQTRLCIDQAMKAAQAEKHTP